MLTDLQIESFSQDGYLVVDHLLTSNELEAIRSEYDECLQAQCQQWISQKKLSPSVANLSFNEQLLATIEAGLDYFQPLDISLPTDSATASKSWQLYFIPPAYCS